MPISDYETLVSGKTSFKVEVPYQLIETGTKGEKKPLLIYLHGYGQNIKTFRKSCVGLLSLEAYHLFVQGPYPVIDKSLKINVSDWGRVWYLYDGNRGQFIKSLELASEFIQEVTDNLLKFIAVNRLCVIGYSMGGYLAGYFALTRWRHVNDLVVAGARIKTEILQNNFTNIKNLNILAVHGKKDTHVRFEPQQSEMELLKKEGAKTELILLNESHSFTQVYIDEIRDWLCKSGYKLL